MRQSGVRVRRVGKTEADRAAMAGYHRRPAPRRLRLRLQRQGFASLMRELGYQGCDPRAETAGDPLRSRISWSHLAADDREGLTLEMLPLAKCINACTCEHNIATTDTAN